MEPEVVEPVVEPEVTMAGSAMSPADSFLLIPGAKASSFPRQCIPKPHNPILTGNTFF